MYFFVTGNQQILIIDRHIAISGSLVTTSEDLNDLNSNTRGCLFPDERNLTLYNNYTLYNCLSDCVLREAEAAAGCAPWNRPTMNTKYGKDSFSAY